MIKKNLFVIVAMLFIGFISPMFIQAQWPTPNLNTTIVPQPKNPGGENQDEGKRDEGNLTYCFISKSEGIVTDPTLFGISSFEIWDSNFENCLYAYPDEWSFVETLFSLSGDFNIRFVTAEYYYDGLIHVE